MKQLTETNAAYKRSDADGIPADDPSTAAMMYYYHYQYYPKNLSHYNDLLRAGSPAVDSRQVQAGISVFATMGPTQPHMQDTLPPGLKRTKRATDPLTAT